MAIEPAADPATPPRPAEEVAREMVSEPVSVDSPNGFCDWSGEIADERVWFMSKDDAFVSLDAIRLGVQHAITRAREEGAAAERTRFAAHPPSELADALDKKAHVQRADGAPMAADITEARARGVRDGAAAERARQQPSATYRPTEAQAHHDPLLAACARSDMTEAQAIELMFARHRETMAQLIRAKEEQSPPMIIVRDGASDVLLQPKPRDVAGRIRALVMQKAGEWLDAEGAARHRLDDALDDLRFAYQRAKDGQDIEPVIDAMREGVAQNDAADELEAIVRESAPEVRR